MSGVSHQLVLGLYGAVADAARGARALHETGIARDRISVVARDHDVEGELAKQLDATPGADIEDSRAAAVLGELSGYALAAIALVMPGIGPIVAAGPLSADLGEAAGHVAGSVASTLEAGGVASHEAKALEREVRAGAILLGVHVSDDAAPLVLERLTNSGARRVLTANWSE